MKDFLGRNIIEGHEVVYPGRCGASMWMNYAVVEKITEGRLLVRRIPLKHGEKERLVWVETPKRVVVVA